MLENLKRPLEEANFILLTIMHERFKYIKKANLMTLGEREVLRAV